MDVEQELLPLLKQLAEGVLKQRQVIQDLEGRVARLEHVLTAPYDPTAIKRSTESHGGMKFTDGGVPVFQGTKAV